MGLIDNDLIVVRRWRFKHMSPRLAKKNMNRKLLASFYRPRQCPGCSTIVRHIASLRGRDVTLEGPTHGALSRVKWRHLAHFSAVATMFA